MGFTLRGENHARLPGESSLPIGADCWSHSDLDSAFDLGPVAACSRIDTGTKPPEDVYFTDVGARLRGATRCRSIPLIPSPDNFHADVARAGHADGMSSTAAEIDRAALHEGTAVIDPNDY